MHQSIRSKLHRSERRSSPSFRSSIKSLSWSAPRRVRRPRKLWSSEFQSDQLWSRRWVWTWQRIRSTLWKAKNLSNPTKLSIWKMWTTRWNQTTNPAKQYTYQKSGLRAATKQRSRNQRSRWHSWLRRKGNFHLTSSGDNILEILF